MSKHLKRSVICLLWSLLLLALLFPGMLAAQYQKKPPDFGDTYTFPTPTHPEPAAHWLRALDVALLAGGLVLAVWLVYKSRSRKGMVMLSIASVAYFGFFRKGCICSIGSIQNVVLCLVNPQYILSMSVIAIFFLPLIATLLFGRVFCGGVCPLGAIQDLVVVRPLRVPDKLDKALRWLQFVYLGLAVFFAGWGLQMKIGAWQIKAGQRFLICEWDPFIAIFRRSGPFYMVVLAVAFVAAGMFIGRPYCRWLCPYGGILSLLSRIAWKNVRISPDKELDCGMCANACPYGAIHNLRADRAECLACSRCYASCPRQKRWEALRAGPKKSPVVAPAVPTRWAGIARTWIGVIAMFLVVGSMALLLGTYVHARRVLPAEKKLVESLKEKAIHDAEIQKILQPELDRQHQTGVARRLVYSRGGNTLIIAGAVLILWLLWLRPRHGTGAGVPKYFLSMLERPPEQRKRAL